MYPSDDTIPAGHSLLPLLLFLHLHKPEVHQPLAAQLPFSHHSSWLRTGLGGIGGTGAGGGHLPSFNSRVYLQPPHALSALFRSDCDVGI